jgi:hypothetical protein
VPISEHGLLKIQRQQTEKNMIAVDLGKVARRWQNFEHHGGIKASYMPFTESFTLPDGSTNGLRSHNGSISTARFAQLLPATYRLACGNDKERLLRNTMHNRKIFVLDAPYLDKTRLGVLVIDRDTNWEAARRRQRHRSMHLDRKVGVLRHNE